MNRKSLLCLAGIFLFLAGCQSQSNSSQNVPSPLAASDVDSSILANADQHPGDWMTYGRTYSEQRFSPLRQINDQNIGQLALAWYMDLDTHRGQEATPLVVDGKMFFTTAWSKVFAVSAATGEILWSYDPKVPPEWAINACCDVVNRGVAVWQGKVFVGTLDGRLIALDAATGKALWETLTIDPRYRYTITGAPRVIKGKVLIGNSGGEFGVRGYISAYDAATGKLAWRFYTVPGDPAKPFESVAIENTAKTWTGTSWKSGAGGTVWDSIVYDPDLDLIYFGVGNGSPWNRKVRSPRGGDNLFTGSVVAINADSGEYAWHYQETPGDSWDYDSAESLILADLTINKTPRKVLLHAPKNGFFYVLDRATGDLLSASSYTLVSWASRIDIQTGRPVENPQARYEEGKGTPVVPGPFGAHSWHPMSFSPLTKLVYIPVQDAGFVYKADEHFENRALGYNAGVDLIAGSLPQQPQIKKTVLSAIKGHLSAWDPIQQKEIWRVDRPSPVNGGVLSTAGNLAFQGTAQGNLEAYRADNGQKLWSADAQSGIVAPPVTYTVNGEQYIAVLAGWGGVFPLTAGEVALSSSGRTQNVSRLLAFKLGGSASLPPLPPYSPPQLKPPPYAANSAVIQKGEALYQRFCATCHGDVAVSGGVLPDLRYSAALGNDRWFEIVLKGQLAQAGMVSFEKEITRPDAAAIRNYVIFRAHQSLAQSTKTPK